ncbi:MAG TPA: DUF92 domain-containing protein [Ktedonobacteraceae bacterium]|jgi:uncharacterized protein (TIGR00297 family)
MMTKLITARNRFSLWRLLAGLIFSSGIGIIAYRRKSLSRSGIIGAILTGTTTVGLGGWSWGLTLIYFFVSSSLLSHWKARDKEQVTHDKFSKGSQRDLGQALANGGVATMAALGYSVSIVPQTREVLQAAYVGALATAIADTWATELGVLSPHAPRMITTGKHTTPGTSGGITPLGTGAGALGAGSLGAVFWLLKGGRKEWRSFPLIALASGVLGSFFDSVLGATIQARYYCPHCQRETEQRTHSCGTPMQLVHGWSWLDNDGVNFFATLFGGLVGIVLQWLCRN